MHTQSTDPPQSTAPRIVRVNTRDELLRVDLDHAINAPVELLEELGLDSVDTEEDDDGP